MTLDTKELIPDFPPLLALSCTPVWAWLIIHGGGELGGGKDFENRVWKPTYPARRLVERLAPFKIYVHASHQSLKDYLAASTFVEERINPGRIEADRKSVV